MSDPRTIQRTVQHRPWPLPQVPWVLYQSWRHLLFAHWKMAPDHLRPLIPEALELDLHEGEAWLGVTPFRIHDFRPRGLPALPRISCFPELNLRTYVRARGRPGIHFFSLDAASRLAVAGARAVFRLPYRHADMQLTRGDAGVRFHSRRTDGGATFRASYAPVGERFTAAAGSLEHFLTERYAFFVVLRSGRIIQTDIHHQPWPLQRAEGEIEELTVPEAEGVPSPQGDPLLHFSRRQDTLIWPPRAMEEGAPDR